MYVCVYMCVNKELQNFLVSNIAYIHTDMDAYIYTYRLSTSKV